MIEDILWGYNNGSYCETRTVCSVYLYTTWKRRQKPFTVLTGSCFKAQREKQENWDTKLRHKTETQTRHKLLCPMGRSFIHRATEELVQVTDLWRWVPPFCQIVPAGWWSSSESRWWTWWWRCSWYLTHTCSPVYMASLCACLLPSVFSLQQLQLNCCFVQPCDVR